MPLSPLSLEDDEELCFPFVAFCLFFGCAALFDFAALVWPFLTGCELELELELELLADFFFAFDLLLPAERDLR